MPYTVAFTMRFLMAVSFRCLVIVGSPLKSERIIPSHLSPEHYMERDCGPTITIGWRLSCDLSCQGKTRGPCKLARGVSFSVMNELIDNTNSLHTCSVDEDDRVRLGRRAWFIECARRALCSLGLKAFLAAALGLSVSCPARGAEPPAPSHWTIIHAGMLLSDARTDPQPKMSILVKDDTITAIRDGYVGAEAIPAPKPEHVKMVELQNQFVMAGMVDAHTHIVFPNLDVAIGLFNVGLMLRGGATTVRDAGSSPEAIFPLRDAIVEGSILGPRIMASGSPLSITGGHADFRNGKLQDELSPPAYSSAVCDGVNECEKATRKQIQFGADQIKVMASGGVSDDSDTGLGPAFSEAELKAIVVTAHRMHRTVMAHALSAESIEAAVDAGVDSVEHGDFLNEEVARLMAQHHVFFDPTLYSLVALQNAIDHPTPSIPMTEKNIRKFRTMMATAPRIAERMALAKRFGLTILAGSDNGGIITDEVVALVEQGHLSPREALVASTVNGADALHLSGQIGTLAPGKSADVIAFDGNPLTNIEDCHKLHFVMARGHVAVSPDTGEGDPTPASTLPK